MLPPRQNFHIIAAYEASSQNWRQTNPFFPASKPQRMSSDCYISFCMICESLSKEWTKRHYVTFLIYFWARDSYCARVRVTLTWAGFTWKWNWHQCNSHLLKTRVFIVIICPSVASWWLKVFCVKLVRWGLFYVPSIGNLVMITGKHSCPHSRIDHFLYSVSHAVPQHLI